MVIILGSGRSGTTWVGKLFDSHPDVVYRHEPDSVNVNTLIPFLPDKDMVSAHVEAAQTYLAQLRTARDVKSSCHRPFFLKNYRSGLKQRVFVYASVLLKGIEQLHISDRPPVWLRIPNYLDAPKGGCSICVIKSVDSLCRAYLFSQAAPNARIIHVVRHPCAVVASRLRGISTGAMNANIYLKPLFNIKESENYPFTYDYLRSCRAEKQMAYQWMVQNDKVFEEMKDSNRYKLLVYEELCAHTKRMVCELFDFVGLEPHEQTEDFLQRLEVCGDGGHAYYNVMRSPRETMDKWRRELDGEQIENVLEVCAHSRVWAEAWDWSLEAPRNHTC